MCNLLFTDTATTEIYTYGHTLFLHDALPISEAAMRAIIEAEHPGDGIIGEEYGNRNPGAGRQWVLDPIDGTTSFIAGRPIFGTLIALMQDRSEEHTSELQSLMRISYAVFCLKKTKTHFLILRSLFLTT